MKTHHHDEHNGQPDLDVRPYTPEVIPQVKPRRKKQSGISNALIILLLLAAIGFVGFKIWENGGRFGASAEQVGEYSTNALSKMDFRGTVTGFKYNDDKRHTKVALLSDGSQYDIYEQWVYYIDANDTLIKARGSLKIEVRKPHGKKEILDYEPILRKLELTNGRKKTDLGTEK